MAQPKVFYFIFGTAATVHDATEQIPISKTRPVKQLSNLYSRIKQMEKNILQDLVILDACRRVAILH